MPPYGNIVEVPQQVNAEGVDKALGDEYGGIDPDVRLCSGDECCIECREGGDEGCTREAM